MNRKSFNEWPCFHLGSNNVLFRRRKVKQKEEKEKKLSEFRVKISLK